MKYAVKILKAETLTHDIMRFVTEKPEGYDFVPGQSTAIALNREGWTKKRRPFTMAALPEDDFVEFIIKDYPGHNGVTKEIHKLGVGDELIIEDAFGELIYKGPGVFMAGGAGITPFMSIFKDLKKKGKIGKNQLVFSNKKYKDVILEDEIRKITDGNVIFTLTEEGKKGYEHRRIDTDFLKEKIKDFSQYFYICGPPRFIRDIKKDILELGAEAEKIIVEK